jgi:hypothetical protein
MMQEVAEHFLAIVCVLDGLQNVGMPELVRVLAQSDFLCVFGVLHQHGEIVLVRHLYAVGVFARPAFSPHGVHHSRFDGLEIERLYCGKYLLHGSGGQLGYHFYFLLLKFKSRRYRVDAGVTRSSGSFPWFYDI